MSDLRMLVKALEDAAYEQGHVDAQDYWTNDKNNKAYDRTLAAFTVLMDAIEKEIKREDQ